MKNAHGQKIWGVTDNSSSTNTRYSIIAEKHVHAYRQALKKEKGSNAFFKLIIGLLGFFFQFIKVAITHFQVKKEFDRLIE